MCRGCYWMNQNYENLTTNIWSKFKAFGSRFEISECQIHILKWEFRKYRIKKSSLLLLSQGKTIFETRFFDSNFFLKKTWFELFSALEWSFFEKSPFLKVSALEIAFLRSQISKILGLSKGFLSILTVFEMNQNYGNLTTNIWSKFKAFGSRFEITFERFDICNLIWLEIIDSNPIKFDRWSLCFDSNHNLHSTLWFWWFLSSIDVLKRH